MTSVWIAEQGWFSLDAAIGLLRPRDPGWSLDVRCRAAEAIAVIDQAVIEGGVPAGTLTLGSDNGTAFHLAGVSGPLCRAQCRRRPPNPSGLK
jgi:putative transposase